MSADHRSSQAFAGVDLVGVLGRIAATDSPDRAFDLLCETIIEHTPWKKAVFVKLAASGLMFGSAGVDDEERLYFRGVQAQFGPAVRLTNRRRVLDAFRVDPMLSAAFVPIEQRGEFPDLVLKSEQCDGEPGVRWEPGDDLIFLLDSDDGVSLGSLNLSAPAHGRRPTSADVEQLAAIESLAWSAASVFARSEDAREEGRAESQRVLGYVEALTGSAETDELLDRLAELCARIAGYRTALITVHMDDGSRIGTCNLGEEERAGFLANAESSTLAGTERKRQRIRELAFPGTDIAYVPHDSDLERGSAFVKGESELPGSWHPEDRLFVLISGTHGRDIGVLSLDEPLDGIAPRADTLGPLRVAERFLQLGGALLEARILDSHLVTAQRLEALGTLAAGVAHDFNNLIGVILGYASLLRMRTTEGSEVSKIAKAVEDASRRAASLTARLRDLAKLSSHGDEVVNLRDVLLDCERVARETFDRRIEIMGEIPEQLPAVRGDSGQLYRCVLNVLINARDAQPEGGKIRIRARSDESTGLLTSGASVPWITVIIDDSGPGIDEALRERVFEPFFTTKARDQGTGLGLFTSYGIAKAHGGTIQLDEAECGGTSVRIMLPAVVPSESEASDTVPPVEPPAPVTAPVRPGHILVVEDEEMLQELVVTGLELLGHTAEVAGDGDAAVAAIDSRIDRFDMVLLDLVLPKRSGVDVYHHLRTVCADTPVLVSSGNVEEGLQDPALREGAAGVLPKPWRLQELQREVQRILGTLPHLSA